MSEDPATPSAETDPKTRTPAVPEAPRKGGMRHLAALLPRLTRPALGRRGFAEGGIVADWPEIVGPDLAAASLPERLAFPRGARRDGTLHVRVSGALALELQHLEPMVVERINGYFGYRAVGRLKIRQGPIPRSRRRQPPPVPVDPAASGEVDHAVSLVSDPGLRSALAGFGRALRGRRS
ncbi:MAG: hypothetical protein BroJett029_04220 [Alphaproteobacteria bacterium]|nr:MAG: hypothetical protein BroJett029_04220 [Alphaproteobacteria bacterium]